jgi:hypothetical protein
MRYGEAILNSLGLLHLKGFVSGMSKCKISSYDIIDGLIYLMHTMWMSLVTPCCVCSAWSAFHLVLLWYKKHSLLLDFNLAFAGLMTIPPYYLAM